MFYTSQKSGNNKQQHRFSALPGAGTGDWCHCQNLGCGASFGAKPFSYFNFPLCVVLFPIISITGLLQGQGAVAVGLQLMSLSRSLELICHLCFVPCRSLNMDFENQDKEKDNSSTTGSFNGNSTNNSKGQLCSFPSVLLLLLHPWLGLSCCIADSQSMAGSHLWKLNLKHPQNISIMQKLHVARFVRLDWQWKQLYCEKPPHSQEEGV